ncbi:MAG: hypothetical protein GF329_20270 [Candidatus Lokiarchaeota archaeon]|nr:hypothetical protein [Candidatus Lokiarchaeota archaeon]
MEFSRLEKKPSIDAVKSNRFTKNCNIVSPIIKKRTKDHIRIREKIKMKELIEYKL